MGGVGVPAFRVAESKLGILRNNGLGFRVQRFRGGSLFFRKEPLAANPVLGHLVAAAPEFQPNPAS